MTPCKLELKKVLEVELKTLLNAVFPATVSKIPHPQKEMLEILEMSK
jgi:hypothetical protein